MTMKPSSFIHLTLRHFQNRLFELATAIMMTGLAVHIMIWPGSIHAGPFRFMLDLIGPVSMVALLGVGGVLRLAALIANGAWPVHGPKLRACGAIIGASVWAQMCTSLVMHHTSTGSDPSTDITVYLVLTSVELIAMCRALVDNGRTR